jgi:hypothetical protein
LKLKNDSGLSAAQPLRGDELRAIGAWLKESDDLRRLYINTDARTVIHASNRTKPHKAMFVICRCYFGARENNLGVTRARRIAVVVSPTPPL